MAKGFRELFLLFFLLAYAAQAAYAGFSDASISGYLKNETAFRYHEPRAFTKIRNILSLKLQVPFSDAVEFTASGWGYYDLAYDLFDYDTISARSTRDILQPLNFIEALSEKRDSPVAEIRELYLDIFLDNIDIRIGKQFVVWGVMTGVRIVDEINPMDFRELILLDLLDYRIPLWTLKVDWYGEEDSLQLLWIPDIKLHKPAPPGSEWELLQEVPGTIYPESFTAENAEWGFRWSRTILDTELSLSYFYTWDDFPVIFRHVRVDVVEEPEFLPTYTRINMYGMTAQRPVGSAVVKGEFVYVTDKYFGLRIIDDDGDGFIDHHGELKKDHYRWGVGLDFNFWKTDFSPGFTQWVILGYEDSLIQTRLDSSFNLFVRKELPNHGAVVQMLALFLVTLDEMYLKPEIIFNVTDRFQIGAGLDLFSGEASQVGVAARNGRAVDLLEIEQRFQFIGNFDNNDRIFMKFKYSF